MLGTQSNGSTKIRMLPDDTTLVTLGHEGVALRDLTTKTVTRRLGDFRGTIGGHTGMITDLAVSPGGELLATGSADHSVRLWDLKSGDVTKVLARSFLGLLGAGHIDGVTAVAFSPGGELLASGGRDGRVYLWDVASGKQLFDLRGHTQPITSLRFTDGGRALASGSMEFFGASGASTANIVPGEVLLWDVGSGKAAGSIDDRFGGVSAMTTSPTGKLLATKYAFGTLLATMPRFRSNRAGATWADHKERIDRVGFSIEPSRCRRRDPFPAASTLESRV